MLIKGLGIVAPFPACTRSEQGAGHSTEALGNFCSLFSSSPKWRNSSLTVLMKGLLSGPLMGTHHWWERCLWYGWSSWEWHPISCEQQNNGEKNPYFYDWSNLSCESKEHREFHKIPNSCDVNRHLWTPGGVFLQSAVLAHQLWGVLLLPCSITSRRTIILWSPGAGIPISNFKYSRRPTWVTWRH